MKIGALEEEEVCSGLGSEGPSGLEEGFNGELDKESGLEEKGLGG